MSSARSICVVSLAMAALLLVGCARTGSAQPPPPQYPPVDRVSDLTSKDLLSRIRALALNPRAGSAEVYEPMLGLRTLSPPTPGAADIVDTLIGWRGQAETHARSRILQLPPRPPERPGRWAVFMLAAPEAGPCITFGDIEAVFGTNHREAPGSLPNFPPDRPPYPPGMPFSAVFELQARPRIGVTFTTLAPCVALISIGIPD